MTQTGMRCGLQLSSVWVCGALAVALVAHSALAQAQPDSPSPASGPLSLPSIQPASLPSSAVAGAPAGAPALSQAKLILKDGRWLVAGNAPRREMQSDHLVGADSEIYDPRSGQWQTLEGLRFEVDQSVYYNQMKDGRVLFFVVTADEDGNLAYSARRWNPSTNRAENISVGLEPVSDDGIAVLGDGRVLVVDSLGGSAILWDSRSNTVTRSEVPELENYSWSAVPLANNTVLLLDDHGEDGYISRNSPDTSAALLWDVAGNQYKRLVDYPARFDSDGLLFENGEGTVHAEVPGSAFSLAATGWVAAPALLQAPLRLIPAAPIAAQPVSAAVQAPQSAPVAARQPESYEWWASVVSASRDDLIVLAVVAAPVLLVWLVFNRLLEGMLPDGLRTSLGRTSRVLVALPLLAAVLILLRHSLWDGALPGAALWEGLNYAELGLFLFIASALFLCMAPLLRAVLSSTLQQEARAPWVRRINRAAFLASTAVVLLFLVRLYQTWYEEFWESDRPTEIVSDEKLMLASFLLAILVAILALRRKEGPAPMEYVHATWRAVVAVIIGLFCFSAWLNYASDSTIRKTGVACAQKGWQPLSVAALKKWALCVDTKSGMLQGALFRPAMDMVDALPAAPCSYVGVWSSTRPGSRYKVTITPDSRFNAVPITGGGSRIAGGGVWGVVGDRMIWFYDAGVGSPADINRILPGPDASHFTLVEVDGMQTQFELMEKPLCF